MTVFTQAEIDAVITPERIDSVKSFLVHSDDMSRITSFLTTLSSMVAEIRNTWSVKNPGEVMGADEVFIVNKEMASHLLEKLGDLPNKDRSMGEIANLAFSIVSITPQYMTTPDGLENYRAAFNTGKFLIDFAATLMNDPEKNIDALFDQDLEEKYNTFCTSDFLLNMNKAEQKEDAKSPTQSVGFFGKYAPHIAAAVAATAVVVSHLSNTKK